MWGNESVNMVNKMTNKNATASTITVQMYNTFGTESTKTTRRRGALGQILRITAPKQLTDVPNR